MKKIKCNFLSASSIIVKDFLLSVNYFFIKHINGKW